MLPESNRLKQSIQIADVFRRGKGFHSPFFSAKYLFHSNEDSRLAFSFSKKYLPQAVKRNRLKRLLIAELQKTTPFFSQGIDVVFFLTAKIDIKDKNELEKSMENFLKKVYNSHKQEN